MPTVDQARRGAKQLGSRFEFETLIADTSAGLVSAAPGELDAMIERSLDGVRRFFTADRCAIHSVNADLQSVHIIFGSNGDGIPPVPHDVNMAAIFPWFRHTLLVDRVPVRIARIADLPFEAETDRAAWARFSLRSVLALPIESRGVVGHLISLTAVAQEIAWPQAFVPRLRALGELLVGALERRAIFDRLQQAEAFLSSGAELAGLALYEVDFGGRATRVDDRFREMFGVPAEQDDGAEAVAYWMDRLHPEDRPSVLHLRDGLYADRVAQFAMEYRYRHPTAGERWIQHVARVSMRDAAGRPLRAFGVLRDITLFKRAEGELAQLGQRLIAAHEAERALLARELHDDVTQRLAVLAIDVGRVELAFPGSPHVAAMRSVREGLVRLSEDVHALAYQLHPSVLEELGLAEALRTECERVARRGPLELSLDLDPAAGDLGKDAALCLFRVTQEALSNVTRHARARAATVTLQALNGGWFIAVRDDGAGFAPDRPGAGRSLGLASMRERVRLAHGTLDIESSPGRGTSITAWVPVGKVSE